MMSATRSIAVAGALLIAPVAAASPVTFDPIAFCDRHSEPETKDRRDCLIEQFGAVLMIEAMPFIAGHVRSCNENNADRRGDARMAVGCAAGTMNVYDLYPDDGLTIPQQKQCARLSALSDIPDKIYRGCAATETLHRTWWILRGDTDGPDDHCLVASRHPESGSTSYQTANRCVDHELMLGGALGPPGLIED